MTLLLAGSIVLIGLSAVALVMGWLNTNETYIWSSIGATVASFILLVIAYLRSKRQQPVVVGGGETTAPAETESVPAQPEATGTPADATPAEAVATAAGGGPATAVSEAPHPPDDSAGTLTPDAAVVAVPRTKKFHRGDCRFASAKGAEPTTRGEAAMRGFEPCGVCKP